MIDPTESQIDLSPVSIIITGKPVPWARSGGGRTVGRFKPEHVRQWQETAAVMAQIEMKGRKPFQGPLTIHVVSTFLPSLSWPVWKREAALRGEIAHTSTPDWDNLGKIFCDALNGVVWIDDCQICSSLVHKAYGEVPSVSILVTPICKASSRITRKDQLKEGV